MTLNIHPDFPGHPKTERLAAEAGQAGCWCFLVLLTQTLRYFPMDGKLRHWSVARIEQRAEWRGEPGKLVEALLAAGFLDYDEATKTYAIHDWEDNNPHIRVYHERSLNANAVRWARAKNRFQKTGRTQASENEAAQEEAEMVFESLPDDLPPIGPILRSTDPEDLPGFAQFWSAWPESDHKVDRRACAKLWNDMGLERQAQTIIDCVEVAKLSEQWKKSKGQYVPTPKRWLNEQHYIVLIPRAEARRKAVEASKVEAERQTVLKQEEAKAAAAHSARMVLAQKAWEGLDRAKREAEVREAFPNLSNVLLGPLLQKCTQPKCPANMIAHIGGKYGNAPARADA